MRQRGAGVFARVENLKREGAQPDEALKAAMEKGARNLARTRREARRALGCRRDCQP